MTPRLHAPLPFPEGTQNITLVRRISNGSDCVTFRILKYLLSTVLLQKSHFYMILSKEKCCLLWTGVSTESKTYLCTSDKAGVLATRHMTHINIGLAKRLLSSWKTCAIWWHGVSRNSGDSCGHLLCSTNRKYIFLYCYDRDFMSDLHKSKRWDIIEMCNDTSQYLDDTFTIDNPEFEKHIPDIYWAQKETIHSLYLKLLYR